MRKINETTDCDCEKFLKFEQEIYKNPIQGENYGTLWKKKGIKNDKAKEKMKKKNWKNDEKLKKKEKKRTKVKKK